MVHLLSTLAWTGVTAPLGHEGGNETLATWKAALTTVLLVVALAQVLNQAVLRGHIRVSRPVSWRQAHRVLGIAAVGLVAVLSGLGLYAWLVLDAPMESAGRVAHVILGGLAGIVLTAKVATSNRFRRQLRLNLPLGVTAFALLAALFAITAVPHFADLLAPAGMTLLFGP